MNLTSVNSRCKSEMQEEEISSPGIRNWHSGFAGIQGSSTILGTSRSQLQQAAGYCFLTRMVPLKERKRTTDAPEFEVPA